MPLSPHVRERILRQLDALTDERGYQVLDFVEFLGSKYAERQPSGPGLLTRFAEGVEDTLRAGRVSTTAIAETMGLLNRAMGVLGGVAAAGKSVASDIVTAASSVTQGVTGGAAGAAPPAPAPPGDQGSPPGSGPSSGT